MTKYYPKLERKQFPSLKEYTKSIEFWEAFDAATPEERAAFEERVTKHIDSKAPVDQKD